MKFEVGKLYQENGYIRKCVFISEKSVLLESLEHNVGGLVLRPTSPRAGLQKEYKEPVVHKGRILVTYDPVYGIDFVVDKSEGKYKVGDVCGRIDTRIVAIKPISYTES